MNDAMPLSLPRLSSATHALFLDIDGTLLDLCDNPQDVSVPPLIDEILIKFYHDSSHALALISGRNIANIKTIFKGSYDIAGLHGSEIFFQNNYKNLWQNTTGFLKAVLFLKETCIRHNFLKIEEKSGAVALHYHFNLAKGFSKKTVRAIALALIEDAFIFCQKDYKIQEGKQVFELRPKAFYKGTAIDFFMKHPPYKDRIAIAIGDDLTDETMFKKVQSIGGMAIHVGDVRENKQILSCAQYHISSPSALRQYLKGQILCQN